MRALLLRALVFCALLALACCGGGDDPARGAPAVPRALAVLEPPQLRVGDVGAIEIAVVTPPGHQVRPIEPPRGTDGLWLLDAERLETQQHPNRWIHRTRIRVRAREVGPLVWPAGTVQVEAPDGSTARLSWEPVPVEVVSVLPELPDRLTPFGVVAPAPPAPRLGWLPAAAGGAALALAAVAGAAWLRRSRGGGAAPPPASPGAAVSARTALARAGGALDADPLAAADGAAAALRRYAAARFGADTLARTVEELTEIDPPFALTTRWPALLRLLSQLDDLRFRPARAPRERVAVLLEQAERFVEESGGGDEP
jgi:hypothetical protein